MSRAMAPLREGHADFHDWRTWYRVAGAVGGGRLPLVVLHGGPGCAYDYVDSIKRLATDGRYDEAAPAAAQPYKDRIKDVRWEIFERSSHMPHVEETDRYLKVVGRFLDTYDRKR